MDFNDFLIELELTEEQKNLAARLKAEAHRKQLLNTLADHALFYSFQAVRKRRERDGRRRPAAVDGLLGDSTNAWRSAVLAWFESLSVAQRVALLTCENASWVRTSIQMTRLRGPPGTSEGRFSLSAAPAAAPKAGRAVPRGRGAPTRTSATGELPRGVDKPFVVHYRRPYRLPDGDVLLPPATAAFRAACDALVRSLRVAFKGGSCTPLSFDWAAISPAPTLLADVCSFVGFMDEISLGRFLRQECTSTSIYNSFSYPVAAWLFQWGSHFPLAAFIGARLEALLRHGFAARLTPAALQSPPPILPLAEIWATMPQQERLRCLRLLGKSVFRRLLSETLVVATSSEKQDHEALPAPAQHLADLLFHGLERSVDACGANRRMSGSHAGYKNAALSIATFAARAPINLVSAMTTVPLAALAFAPEGSAMDMLTTGPTLWLHQQFAAEFAVACSEHSACTLLDREGGAASATGNPTATRERRREKKHRQKLRRQGRAMAKTEEELKHEPQEVSETLVEERPFAEGTEADSLEMRNDEDVLEQTVTTDTTIVEDDNVDPQAFEARESTAMPLTATCHTVEERQEQCLEHRDGAVPGAAVTAKSPPVAEESEDHVSEVSSIGGLTTSRSTVSEASFMSYWRHKRRWGVDMRHMLHARRMPLRASTRWHDDSRLEFLLRSRDRYGADADWDGMSAGSVPASLDEAAVFPMGLETRFSYLFDTPPRSRVTSAQPSQAATDDDAERLRVVAQWGGPDDDKWHSLTEALEIAQAEVQRWKARAEFLEELVARGPHGPSSGGPHHPSDGHGKDILGSATEEAGSAVSLRPGGGPNRGPTGAVAGDLLLHGSGSPQSAARS